MKLPAFLLLLASAIAVSAADKPGSPPNILLIMIDDLRPQLGCYAHSETFSLNIDKLANRGVMFTNAHCNVPVCGASRASLMTGMRPTPERFKDAASWAMKDANGAKSMAQVFKD